jgi:hypothetical protein
MTLLIKQLIGKDDLKLKLIQIRMRNPFKLRRV